MTFILEDEGAQASELSFFWFFFHVLSLISSVHEAYSALSGNHLPILGLWNRNKQSRVGKYIVSN